MNRKAGIRQREILTLLMAHRTGLSIDEVAECVGISRTAVQQHFSALEQRGYVAKAARHKTGGRPVQIYKLTDAGLNYFPKQYAWFSELLLRQLKHELGDAGLLNFLTQLGTGLAQELAANLAGKSLQEKLEALLTAMQDLGYQASIVGNQAHGVDTIQALHCVYHDIAKQLPEVCQFDRALLTGVLGCDVEQTECMAQGGNRCCFKLKHGG